MGSYAALPFDIKKIAIIGAGPCGLSAAKYLLARGFQSIVIFEQQDRPGGIWYYSHDPPGLTPVPQTDPFCRPDPPLPPRQGNKAPIFPSPMYETLHANIPGSLMNYKDWPFPKDAWAFPSREVILDYVRGYAEDVKHLIKFCVQVDRVDLRQDAGRDKWDFKASSTVSDESHNDTFDAVVVANGHYSIPFIPDVKGIREFNEAHPGIVIHSKNYRTPEVFKGQKVVVVGNGPSGLDIARQISGAGAETIMSVRSPTGEEKRAHVGASEVAEIVEFVSADKSLRIKDGSVVHGVDAVVYCTGFLFNYPFLPGLDHQLLTSGKGVHGLYQHIFHIDHPTLVFPGLPIKAVPFPLSEAQAAAVAAVWDNSLPLPPAEEMRKWDRELHRERGEALHTFPTHGGDGHYINELHDWTMKATSPGREPPYWGDELMWQRSIFGSAKLAFEKQGCKAKTLEDLGFVYPGKKE